MKTKLFTLALFLLAAGAWAQQEDESVKMKPEMTEIWDPEVSIITPGATPVDAPSDAIVLFDGVDLGREWTNGDGGEPGWLVEDECATVVRGQGIIKTKRVFEDFQLHIEWRTPAEVVGESQGRGNSGIFLQGRYEVQVLDNFNNRTYRNGQAGSLYKQHAPLVNACKAPGLWQVYDIIYTAPRFNDDGTYFTPPTVTVLHNGVLVQNHVKLRGPTEYVGIPEYSVKKHGADCIMLQDHGNPVSYRNIWIREL
uniref:3-keto-disaccharide hydrolase n=1 Tax=uncultured Draconibacterium sp. TaxID=1573823 RepID=UPI00321777EE